MVITFRLKTAPQQIRSEITGFSCLNYTPKILRATNSLTGQGIAQSCTKKFTKKFSFPKMSIERNIDSTLPPSLHINYFLQ